MPEIIHSELPGELLDFLQGEVLVFLTTVNSETVFPHVAAVTWMLARDEKLLRFGMDPRAQSVANISGRPEVVVMVPGPTSCFAIDGIARVGQAQLPGVTLRMIMVEVNVERVRDVMFYGGRLTETPSYEKTYDAKLAEKFDTEVFNALRTAPFE